MDAPFSQGRVILGKYRVDRVIGKGAMGVVLAARHIQLDDRVAIKLLLPEMMAEPGVVDRFLQEARAARKIKSEHVAQVSDVGLMETGTPYIIMEYLEGKDLAKVRSERGALDVDEVLDYILQACEAIAEAHACGIIHRDLKPANLFLTRRTDGSPLVKVLDFGTSKMAPKETVAGGMEMTQTGMAIGSPSYMSPEQMLSSRNLDARSDIWALGVIIYNLLTGTFPFKADTLLQMCAAVIQMPPRPPTDHRPDLPKGLEQVILRCLGKKPEDRFSDVAGLARALLPFAPAQSRLSVERIERVLGVATDLATFLAPSIRTPPAPAQPEVERIEVPPMPTPSEIAARSSRQPEAAILTKSLSGSSLATVVRTTETSSVSVAPSPSAGKRGNKGLFMGVGVAVALCLGLLVTVRGSQQGGDPVASASAAESPFPPAAAPAQQPMAASPVPPANQEPIEVVNPGSPATGTGSVPAVTASAAPGEPNVPAVVKSPATPSAPNAAVPPPRSAGAPGAAPVPHEPAGTAPATAPAPAPSPPVKKEPVLVIPDDR